MKRKINSWTYFWLMQRVSSVMKIDNMKDEWIFFLYSMFRKKLRKSDLFTRCFLKVNTFLTMWSNCVLLSFIHFLLMLLFRLRLLESTARNVHTHTQIWSNKCVYTSDFLMILITLIPPFQFVKWEQVRIVLLFGRSDYSFFENWQATFNWTQLCLVVRAYEHKTVIEKERSNIETAGLQVMTGRERSWVCHLTSLIADYIHHLR